MKFFKVKFDAQNIFSLFNLIISNYTKRGLTTLKEGLVKMESEKKVSTHRRSYSNITPLSMEPSNMQRSTLSKFIRMCSLQLGSHVSFAIELTVIVPIANCYQLSLKYFIYFWAISSILSILLLPAIRNVPKMLKYKITKLRLFVILLGLLQVLGVTMMVLSKDIFRLTHQSNVWEDIINDGTTVYCWSLMAVIIGFTLIEIMRNFIDGLYMELLFERYRPIYDTTGVQCLNLFRGVGMVVGFFIGRELLNPITCKFWYPPLVVFFVFYTFTFVSTIISLKKSKDNVATERTPLDSFAQFNVTESSSSDFEYKGFCQSYSEHYQHLKTALGDNLLFVVVQIIAWWSLMHFLYLFTHMETTRSSRTIRYLISLTKDAKELKCDYTTTAFGLCIYAFTYCCYCAGIKKLKKFISTVNLYCGSMLLFALGMTILATIPSCIGVLLIPIFPGTLHATLSSVTSLRTIIMDPADRKRASISLEDQTIAQFSFLAAQLLWSVTTGPIISVCGALHGILWVSAIVSSLGAIIASKLCTPSAIRDSSSLSDSSSDEIEEFSR